MTEDEIQQQIEDAIAERLPEAVAQAIANMDEGQREQIGRSLSPFMADRQPALRSPKSPHALRWLHEGVDINGKGFDGPTLPHVINLGGVTAAIDPINSDQLNVTFSGGVAAGDGIILTTVGNTTTINTRWKIFIPIGSDSKGTTTF